MLIYCTYCSAEKNQSKSNISAIDLYKSTRIANVFESACASGINMVILSGKYGIIPAQQEIKPYDHFLIAEEVYTHSDLVANQMKGLGITELIFFTNRVENDSNLKPYHTCIKKACKNAGVRLSIEESNYVD